MAAELRITEIFLSLQGESTRAGLPTVFVRLTGCPLRCNYCDTTYAFAGGEKLAIAAILERVAAFSVCHVTVTGGEPLAQVGCRPLLSLLCARGHEVSIETSGALAIAGIDRRVAVVMDLKTPSSGEQQRNLYDNVAALKDGDELKFVIADRDDYEWVKSTLTDLRPASGVEILLAPSYGVIAPSLLGDWMLADRLAARLQIQLHKYLWGDEPGR